MADSTLPDAYVQKFLNNFAIAKINAEVDTITAARYGVRSYPTTLILKPNGIEIDRLIGYYPPEDFVTGIINALTGIGTLEDYLDKLAADPRNGELQFEVGQKYRYRGNYDQAAVFFAQVMANDSARASGKAAEAAFNLGHMRYKLKDYPGAVALWRQQIAQFPEAELNVDAELMIAYSYQKAGDFKNAKKEYNYFLKKYPDTEEKDWIAEQMAAMAKKK
ncbi:MAG: tetratricopeptide repeat protein [candidate division Zixibacteria bacterium]|nr:tetratricopeptide repeat protein [candidate division Zixibacteria bacterium]